MPTNESARGAVTTADTVKVADRDRVRAVAKKIRQRDAELLKRLAR